MSEESEKEQAQEQKIGQQKEKSTSLGEAVGAGAFGGAVAGLAAHYLAGGRMILPIFMVAYILILSGLKGWGRFVALVVFTIVASFIVVLFQRT